MRYETLLKVDTFFLFLAVCAIVALLVIFYYTAKDNARQQAYIEKQDREIRRLYAQMEQMATDDYDAEVKRIASEMLDSASIDEAVKTANEYYEQVKETLTAELWRQYHERCARGEQCTKK